MRQNISLSFFFLERETGMGQKYSTYRKFELYFAQKTAPEIYFAHQGRWWAYLCYRTA